MARQDKPLVEKFGENTDRKAEPRWWLAEKGEVYKSLIPYIRQIEQRQMYRMVANIRNACLYENTEMLGTYASTMYRTISNGFTDSRLKMNCIAANVDTARSKIAKTKPRPVFLTEEGNWEKQQRAKDLQRFVDGHFQAEKIYEKFQKAFLGAAVQGTGAVKFFKQDSRVCAETAVIDEILVDDADAIYGDPTMLHQPRVMNRYTLADMFPKFVDKIFEAPGAFGPEVNSPGSKDMIRIFESWRLPDGSKKGGRHVICIDGADLSDEDYKRKYFPFVFFRWKDRLNGFYGMGVPDEIGGIQMELDKVVRVIQKGIHLVAVPRVWVESTSAVGKNTITNEVGMKGEYTGTPPTIVPGQAFGPEVYTYVESLWRRSFECTGVSMMSATSKKPEGLNSGVAIREYLDNESERFQMVSQDYENVHMEAANIIIDMMDELGNPTVVTSDGKVTEKLNWKDVKMDRDEYQMRVFPASLLPTQPAGRLQRAIELVEAGFLPKEMALSVLDFPDVDASVSLQTAAYDDVRMVIASMMKTGEYIPPEPYQNLQLTLSISQSAYLKAKTQNAPEEILELLRRYIDDTKTLLDKAAMQAQQQAMQSQAAMAPIAQPNQPPTSDMLPTQVGAA